MAFNLAGVYPTLLTARRIIRRSVRQRLIASIPKSELSTLRFKTVNGSVIDPEFIMEKDDEFSYYGEMYDIVKAETQGDEIIYTCFADRKETSIVSLLKRKIKDDIENSPITKKTGQTISKVMSAVYLPVGQIAGIPISLLMSETGDYNEACTLLIYQSVDTPPPKNLV